MYTCASCIEKKRRWGGGGGGGGGGGEHPSLQLVAELRKTQINVAELKLKAGLKPPQAGVIRPMCDYTEHMQDLKFGDENWRTRKKTLEARERRMTTSQQIYSHQFQVRESTHARLFPDGHHAPKYQFRVNGISGQYFKTTSFSIAGN